MLDDIVGNYGGRLLVAAGGVGFALLALIGILWLMRNRAPSPFVRGGKNRQPRLQVLDAAAVDARRRLVLVRRDGVEHLIMIGGPTDIVIESGIGDQGRLAQPTAMPLEAPAIAEPRPVPRLEPVREAPRAIARQPEPEKQLPTPPARAAIEPPAIPLPERAELPRPATKIAPVVATAAAIAPPMTPPVQERLQPVAITPAPAPLPPTPPTEVVPAPVTPPERKEVAEAVDILEAARQRVLPPQVDHPQKISEKEASPLAPPQTPILAQDAYREASFEDEATELPEAMPEIPPKQLGSDFESILEAEMTNNLKAERVVPATPAAAAPERREPEMHAGRKDEAALQDEMERIFGEISVKR